MTDVAEIRRKAGLSQTQLADLSGVAQPNIAAYENGSRRPSAKMLQRLSAAAKPRPSRVLATHKDAIKKIAGEHKALDVRVFGSVARGDDQPGSDLDLLVCFAPDASIFDQAELVEDLRNLLGINVDVVSEGGLRPGHDQIRHEARAL
jgi:predicted nucleotidyltransferase